MQIATILHVLAITYRRRNIFFPQFWLWEVCVLYNTIKIGEVIYILSTSVRHHTAQHHNSSTECYIYEFSYLLVRFKKLLFICVQQNCVCFPYIFLLLFIVDYELCFGIYFFIIHLILKENSFSFYTYSFNSYDW